MTVAEPAASPWRDVGEIKLTPILEGALAVFSEFGYHGTSVRDIAGRVGVTVPALYYHHPNKEAILLALLTLATENIAWRVEAAAQEAGDSPRQALGNIVEAIVGHMTHHRGLAILDFEARYLSDENRAQYVAPRRRIEETVASVIRAGVDGQVFATAQPREATRALLGMLQWITRWYHPGGVLQPGEIADRYVALALVLVESR